LKNIETLRSYTSELGGAWRAAGAGLSETRYEDRTIANGFCIICTFVLIRVHHTCSTVRLRRTTSCAAFHHPRQPFTVGVFLSMTVNIKNNYFHISPEPVVRRSSENVFVYDIIILLLLSIRPSIRRTVDCFLVSTLYARYLLRTFPNRIEAVPVDMLGPTFKRLSSSSVSDYS